MKEMYTGKASLVQIVSLGTVSTEFAYWRKFRPGFHSINIYGFYMYSMHKSRAGIGQSLDCLCAFTSGHFFCQHWQLKMYAFTLHSSVTQIKTVFPSDFSLGLHYYKVCKACANTRFTGAHYVLTAMEFPSESCVGIELCSYRYPCNQEMSWRQK